MLKEYLSALANAFRTVLGTTDKINAQCFPDKVAEVYEAGKQAEYDKFWDAFQKNGTRTNYEKAFFAGLEKESGWTDDIYRPKYPIVTTNGNHLFWCARITDTKVPITIKTNGHCQYTFGACSNLVTIRKLILEGTVSTWANAFVACGALENIDIEGTIDKDINFKSCGKLTKESHINIFNVLSSTTSGLTATFNKTAVDTAFETSEGAGDGSTSEEWLNLIATKSNWTISLV